MEIQKSVVAANDRKKWIGLLSSADPGTLEAIKKDLDAPIDFTYIVKPETGMLMVQAKTDGSKARFNLGEATVSRCILEIKEHYIGASWIMGSDLKHAELAALFDGLMQVPQYNQRLNTILIDKLKEKQKTKDEIFVRDAANTKVNFFTLKRGE